MTRKNLVFSIAAFLVGVILTDKLKDKEIDTWHNIYADEKSQAQSESFSLGWDAHRDWCNRHHQHIDMTTE